jgi:hypothetical protein
VRVRLWHLADISVPQMAPVTQADTPTLLVRILT